MPRIGLDAEFRDEAYEPPLVDVEATQAALLADEGITVGKDTAAVLTRRDALKAKAAAYRAKTGADLDIADMIDALIAAVFDA